MKHSPLVRYGVAVLAVGLALLLMLLLEPLMERSIFFMFVLAVMISSLYSGLGPGLLATVLSSSAIAYFLLSPAYSLNIAVEETLRLGIFVLVALLIVWLTTVRRGAEVSLQESEERFRATLEQATVGIAHTALDGRWLRVNQSLCEILGYTREELLEKTFQEITHPDDLEDNLGYMRLLLAGEISTFSMEKRYIKKDGSVVWVNLTVSLVREPAGDPSYFIAVLEDISKRKRAEEELRVSEERYRAVVEQAAEGICLVDADTKRLLEANPEFQRLFDYAPEEIPGLSLYDFVSHDREDIDRNFQLTLEKGSHTAGERRYRRKDGSLIDVMASGSAIFYNGRKVASLVIRDITEHKRAEEASARLAAIVKSSDDAIIAKTLDGIITSWNSGAQRLYGYSSEEVIGEPISILVPPNLPNDIPQILEKIRRGEAVDHYETVRMTKDGRQLNISLTVSPIKDSVGNVIAASAIARDITERKRYEEVLRQSEELYRSVVEQAAENIFLVDVETRRVLQANAAVEASLGYTAEELGQMTLYDLVAHDQESIDGDIQGITEEGHSFLGERQHRRKDGLLVDMEVSVSMISYEGREAMCIVTYDVTERKQVEDDLRQSLSMLLALREAGQILGSTLESEEIASRLLEIMRRVLNLSAAVISAPDESGEDLRIWRSVGLEELWPRTRFAPEAAAARWAVLKNKETNLARLQHLDFESGHLVGLYLPLRTRNSVIGVLEAYGQEALAESDSVQLLASLANQAASALENARLYGELAKRERSLQELVGKLLSTQEEERRRVAYEVHDGLAQVAVAAHQRLQAFARRHPPDTERSQRDLERVLGLVRQTVSDARKIIAYLRPTVLDDFGLVAAISLEIERMREEGYQVDYEEELGDERLLATVEIALFRIAQEALTNVRKHAHTKRVRVELRRQGDEVYLEVRDFGQGFDSTVAVTAGGPGERIGLAGMRERAGILGGRLEIHSQPGAATSVIAVLPLPTTAEEN